MDVVEKLCITKYKMADNGPGESSRPKWPHDSQAPAKNLLYEPRSNLHAYCIRLQVHIMLIDDAFHFTQWVVPIIFISIRAWKGVSLIIYSIEYITCSYLFGTRYTSRESKPSVILVHGVQPSIIKLSLPVESSIFE